MNSILELLFDSFNYFHPSVVVVSLLVFIAFIAARVEQLITWLFWAIFSTHICSWNSLAVLAIIGGWIFFHCLDSDNKSILISVISLSPGLTYALMVVILYTPIWIWTSLVVLGATVGSYFWWRNSNFDLGDIESQVYVKSILIWLASHMILFMFEWWVCYKLESRRHLWIVLFIPFMFISIGSIAICILSLQQKIIRELVLFCVANVVQSIFLALRLDASISWFWKTAFVALCILLCLLLVFALRVMEATTGIVGGICLMATILGCGASAEMLGAICVVK